MPEVKPPPVIWVRINFSGHIVDTAIEDRGEDDALYIRVPGPLMTREEALKYIEDEDIPGYIMDMLRSGKIEGYETLWRAVASLLAEAQKEESCQKET